MRLLIMCEGSNEKKIVDMLLEHGCFKFTEDDLLGLTPFHARQINSNGQVKAELNIYPDDVKILRIGDKQSDKLAIPAEYKGKIVEVEKYCTKPELEILLIIAYGMISEYDKVKSEISPKKFCKKWIKYNKKSYDNSSKFYEECFGDNINLLVDSIKEYQRIHGKSHAKDEHCLAELLK